MEVKEYEFDIKKIQFIKELSPKDERDYDVASIIPMATIPPENFKVTDWNVFEIDHQNLSGMCTAFSSEYCKAMSEYRLTKNKRRFSRKFLYLNRDVNSASYSINGEGMLLRDVIMSLYKNGICEAEMLDGLSMWMQDKDKNFITPEMIHNALQYKIENFLVIKSNNDMKTTMMTYDSPLILCIPVTNAFAYAKEKVEGFTFDVSNTPSDFYGYHAVACVGWETINGKTYFIIRNSWGKTWGKDGYILYSEDAPILERWLIIDKDTKPKLPEKVYKIMSGDYMTKETRDTFLRRLKLLKVPFNVITLKTQTNKDYYKVNLGTYSNRVSAENALSAYSKYKFANLKIVEINK